MLAALGAAAMFACGDSTPENGGAAPAADAPVASATTVAAAPAPALPVGTAIEATLQDSISSLRSRVGDRIRAVVSLNVSDGAGHVIIPGGSEISLTVATITPGSAASASAAAISLDVGAIAAPPHSYEAQGTIARVPFTLRKPASGADARELTVNAGTPITIRLTAPLAIAAK
jgi:hypothetical protein